MRPLQQKRQNGDRSRTDAEARPELVEGRGSRTPRAPANPPSSGLFLHTSFEWRCRGRISCGPAFPSRCGSHDMRPLQQKRQNGDRSRTDAEACPELVEGRGKSNATRPGEPSLLGPVPTHVVRVAVYVGHICPTYNRNDKTATVAGQTRRPVPSLSKGGESRTPRAPANPPSSHQGLPKSAKLTDEGNPASVFP